MKMDEKINLAENEYYRIVCLFAKKGTDGKWLARIRILRKDTNEYVKGGFTIFDYGKDKVREKVIAEINNSLMPRLIKSGPPTQWNTDVRKIMAYASKFRSSVLRFGNYCEDAISSQDKIDQFGSKYSSFWKRFIKETIALNKMVQQLSTEERISLLVSPEEVFKDPSDSWNLDDLDTRIMIFDFLTDPTKEEKIAHNSQLKRLSDRYEELGWD